MPVTFYTREEFNNHTREMTDIAETYAAFRLACHQFETNLSDKPSDLKVLIEKYEIYRAALTSKLRLAGEPTRSIFWEQLCEGRHAGSGINIPAIDAEVAKAKDLIKK